jgi:hypothetical protein
MWQARSNAARAPGARPAERSRGRPPVAVAVALVTALGCATPHAPAERPQSSVITEQEIVASRAPTALEAIRLLRPGFLASRGPTSLIDSSEGFPNVYVDDVPYGAFATLSQIRAEDIASIRIYRAAEATYRYGTGNPGGVIAIATKH